MPCQLGRVCLALGGSELGLFRGQPRVSELREELGGHLMRPRSPQMSVYGPHPRTPSSLERHTDTASLLLAARISPAGMESGPAVNSGSPRSPDKPRASNSRHSCKHLGVDPAPAPAFPILVRSDHQTAVTGTAVEQSDRSPMTMAGADLLFFSRGYLGVVLRRRA
jgi:hypothetical protein